MLADGFRAKVIFPPPLPNDPETRQTQERRLEEMDFAAEAVFAASQGMLAPCLRNWRFFLAWWWGTAAARSQRSWPQG